VRGMANILSSYLQIAAVKLNCITLARDDKEIKKFKKKECMAMK
jgi:hypothetical protein